MSLHDEKAGRTALGGVALLVVSAITLGLAPLAMPAGYSWITHSTSESAAQGLEYAWVARLGFLAFGFGVLAISRALEERWARPAVWMHVGFAVLMIATAAFSHRPWIAGVHFDPVEDALHSLTATAMGFAFSFGLLACLVQRRREGRPGWAVDLVALVAATVIPLVMVRLPHLQGVPQRLMFLIAYVWYAREALQGSPGIAMPSTPAGGRG